MFRARLVNPLPLSTLKTPHSLILWQNIFRSVTSGKQTVTSGPDDRLHPRTVSYAIVQDSCHKQINEQNSAERQVIK